MNTKAKIMLGIVMVLGIFLLPKNVAMAASDEELKILESINSARIENGLAPYSLDEDFCKCAEVRASEQATYYSHTRPDGRAWYTVSPYVNRENIACITAEYQKDFVIEAWMQSGIHRGNILSTTSTTIGIGIYETKNNVTYIVTLTD